MIEDLNNTINTNPNNEEVVAETMLDIEHGRRGNDKDFGRNGEDKSKRKRRTWTIVITAIVIGIVIPFSLASSNNLNKEKIYSNDFWIYAVDVDNIDKTLATSKSNLTDADNEDEWIKENLSMNTHYFAYYGDWTGFDKNLIVDIVLTYLYQWESFITLIPMAPSNDVEGNESEWKNWLNSIDVYFDSKPTFDHSTLPLPQAGGYISVELSSKYVIDPITKEHKLIYDINAVAKGNIDLTIEANKNPIIFNFTDDVYNEFNIVLYELLNKVFYAYDNLNDDYEKYYNLLDPTLQIDYLTPDELESNVEYLLEFAFWPLIKK